MSKIGSIYPFTIRESKPGVHPCSYVIEGCEDIDKPTIVDIVDGYYNIVSENDIHTEVPIPAEQIAISIVNDFITSCMAFSPEAHPGLFVVNNLTEDLKEAQKKQWAWYRSLVDRADNDWAIAARPGSINRLQRHAAESLKLEREWMTDTTNNPSFCPACTRKVIPTAVVCMHCQCVLDPERYKTLQFAGAGKG